MTPNHEEALRALRIADRDIIAFHALRRDADVALASVCFFAQQSVEKCLKAVLFFHGIEFPPVHDLAKLAQLLIDHDKTLPYSQDDLRKLNPFAVVFRYDDQEIETFSRDEAQMMVESTRRWAGNIIQT